MRRPERLRRGQRLLQLSWQRPHLALRCADAAWRDWVRVPLCWAWGSIAEPLRSAQPDDELSGGQVLRGQFWLRAGRVFMSMKSCTVPHRSRHCPSIRIFGCGAVSWSNVVAVDVGGTELRRNDVEFWRRCEVCVCGVRILELVWMSRVGNCGRTECVGDSIVDVVRQIARPIRARNEVQILGPIYSDCVDR